MKNNQYFDDFLKNEVNINQSRLDSLNDKVRAVSEFLSQNLDSFEKVERQGSYALHTIIKPVQDGQEYDADILLFMKYEDSKTPKEYIDELRDCLRRSKVYDEKAKRKTRCVMLDYAGDFHLDIVPCVEKPSGRKYVCNYQTDEFEETDGTGYRNWLNEKTRITSGNLKRVTRLLKFLRGHKGNFTAKSILLTTLIGKTVLGEYDAKNFNSVAEALKTVSNRINKFLQDNPTMPTVNNPVLPSEDFTRHWDEKKYTHFRKMFDIYNTRINEAYDATEHNDSVKKWRKVFGEKFGKLRGNTTNGAAKTGATITTGSVAVTPRKPYAG